METRNDISMSNEKAHAWKEFVEAVNVAQKHLDTTVALMNTYLPTDYPKVHEGYAQLLYQAVDKLELYMQKTLEKIAKDKDPLSTNKIINKYVEVMATLHGQHAEKKAQETKQ